MNDRDLDEYPVIRSLADAPIGERNRPDNLDDAADASAGAWSHGPDVLVSDMKD